MNEAVEANTQTVRKWRNYSLQIRFLLLIELNYLIKYLIIDYDIDNINK